MKKIISVILSAAMLVSIFVSCGEKEENITSVYDTDTSINVNCPDYYPYNTFMDCDDEYIYFVNSSVTEVSNNSGGIYRMPKQGGNAELIYKHDPEVLKYEDKEFYFPILSLVCWRDYIYFVYRNSIYRISKDGENFEKLLTFNKLLEYTQNDLAGIHYLREYDDVLYAVDVNFPYLAFNLNESDALEDWSYLESNIRHDNAPISEFWNYQGDSYVFENNENKCVMNSAWSFFDYQSNCVADLYMGNFTVSDLNGHRLININLDSNHPCTGDTDDKSWANFSNKKAYRFLKISHYSDEGELISQDEFYSLVIYDLAQQSYKIIELSDDFLSSRVAIDIIDDKAYWTTCSGNIACYDTVSDELYLIV